jgi:hypothetical protein
MPARYFIGAVLLLLAAPRWCRRPRATAFVSNHAGYTVFLAAPWLAVKMSRSSLQLTARHLRQTPFRSQDVVIRRVAALQPRLDPRLTSSKPR